VAQVKFERLETGFSLYRFKGCDQALSSSGSTELNLHRPTARAVACFVSDIFAHHGDAAAAQEVAAGRDEGHERVRATLLALAARADKRIAQLPRARRRVGFSLPGVRLVIVTWAIPGAINYS
jgi:hypothetical protein